MSYTNVSSHLCRSPSEYPPTTAQSPTTSAAFSGTAVASTPLPVTVTSAGVTALPHHPPISVSYALNSAYPTATYCGGFGVTQLDSLDSRTFNHAQLSSQGSSSYDFTPPLSTLTRLSTDSSSGDPNSTTALYSNSTVAYTYSPVPTTGSNTFHAYAAYTPSSNTYAYSSSPQPPQLNNTSSAYTSGTDLLRSPSEATLLFNYRQLLVDPYAVDARFPYASAQPTSAQLLPSTHLYHALSTTPADSLPLSWPRARAQLRHLCAANITCLLLVLLPVLIAGLLILLFVLQEKQDKQDLHQYAIYAFIIFCVAFIFPFALFFFVVLINRIVHKYNKCFNPQLAAAAEFAEFAAALPYTASGGFGAWPELGGSAAQFPFSAYEAALLHSAQAGRISTLNVHQLGATGAGGSGNGPNGSQGGRLSGSSVSSLTGSMRGRQRLIRQDAFECPLEYAAPYDMSGGGPPGDHPPSYELALLCRKSTETETKGESSTAQPNASLDSQKTPADSTANEHTPPPPYDEKTMALKKSSG